MKIVKRLTLAGLFCILAASIALAQAIPQASSPEEVGFLKERLDRIATWLKDDVDKKVIPGAVVMILSKGKIAYYEAFGYQDREKNIPMARNSIFRLYSMTKPVVSLGAMMLAEEGKIQIGVPVSRYLPEFKDLKVGVEKKDSATDKVELVLEPPSREMTVLDLLRHTSGITYGIFPPKTMVKDLYQKANLFDFNQTNTELVTKFSKLPLQFHPGTTWDYSMSTDVLARIIEVTSGVNIDTFIADRIVKPLKLTDMAYWAEGAERQARVAEPQIDPKTGKRPMVIPVTEKLNWTPGNIGLVSTAHDYARFCLMLLYGGTRDGVRLVSPKTIEHMTSNHIPPGFQYVWPVQSQLYFQNPGMEVGVGFGLGFAVVSDPERSPLPASKGLYYWKGAQGTSFFVDPKEELIAIIMTQERTSVAPYEQRLRHFVYQAIGG
jgi:CubicO group peptidase (beta-lactamase class C family)